MQRGVSIFSYLLCSGQEKHCVSFINTWQKGAEGTVSFQTCGQHTPNSWCCALRGLLVWFCVFAPQVMVYGINILISFGGV